MALSLEDQIAYGWASMRQVRGQHSAEHIHIARYIRPELAEWFEERKTTDRPAIEMLWDDTAIKANEMFARGLWSMAHNPSTEWFSYSDKNPRVMNDSEATAWYGRVNDDLRSELKASGCYTGLLTRLLDVGAFGYGALYSYETAPGKMSFEYVPASECFYELGRDGLARKFFRPLNLTAHQAIDDYKFSKEKVDRTVQHAYENKDFSTKFLFLHVVWERRTSGGTERSNLDYPFAGFYYQVANRTVVNEHGFRRFPYHVLSWAGSAAHPYPIGIGYRTLPEIRNVNATRRDNDLIVRKEADSPILAPSQAEVPGGEQFRPNPGDVLFGGMTADGKPLYQPFYKGENGRSLLQEILDGRHQIQEAWHYSLFMMQTQRQMTAEEVRSRDAKIVQAMGPFMILFAPDAQTVIERVFFSRLNAGFYDPLPAIFDGSTKMELEFSGILAKAQQVLEGEQIVQLLTEGQLIAAFDPDAVLLGTDFGEAWRHLASSKSVPRGIVRTKEAYEKALAESRQIKQAQQAAAMAPDLARAAKDGASAVKDINAATQTGGSLAA